MIPKYRASLRCTTSLGVSARMGVRGRYRETRIDVLPDSVAQTMSLAPTVCAVRTAA